MDDSIKLEIANRIDKVKNYLNISKVESVEAIGKDKRKVFKEFYYKNIDEIMECAKVSVEVIEKFNNEYPLSRIKEMTIEEYALGKENKKDTLSYKLEFGCYKAGIGIGGGTSSKHGMYYSKIDDSIKLVFQKEVIEPEKVKEIWNGFREQLYSFLKEYETTEVVVDIHKYPMLKGMGMVLTKLLYFYYPKKFLSIASKDGLIKLLDYFEYDYKLESVYGAETLNFVLNKNIKEDMDFLDNTNSQYIGDSLWLFLKNVLDEDKTDEATVETENTIIPYDKEKFLEEVFIEEDKYDNIIKLLEKKKNIILQGAPGVGKTFMAKKLVYSLMKNIDKSRVSFLQFHQSYSYEEFIEGYRPTSNGGFELENGIFYDICKKAKRDDKPYYLIIDEINRGNLSKIFGELLMLIESDKREEKLTLAYSKEEFSVPSNLYIIGLMNTADRSLAMIDYALRRRFSFINIEPAYESEKFKKKFAETFDDSCTDVLSIIEDINNDIMNDPSLGSGFLIGHSYFCIDTFNTKANKEDIKRILTYEIKPLIEEYWYDENDKLEKWRNKIKNYVEN